MCDINLVNIGGADCEPVAGVTSEVLIAPLKDFTVVGQPPQNMETYDDPAELVTVTAAHTFGAGKGFTTIEGVEETGTVTTTMIGETGRHIFQNEFTIQVAGSKAQVLGFMRLVKNGKFIVLVTEFGSGNIRQIGSKAFPAKFTVLTSTIEATAEGNNSVTLTVQDKQKWPAPVYPGTLTVTMKPEPEEEG